MEPYANLHGHINDMEHRVNERLREMIVPDLVRFKAVIERVRVDIIALQSQKILTFLILVDEDSEEEEEVLYDITGKLVNSKRKGKRKKK